MSIVRISLLLIVSFLILSCAPILNSMGADGESDNSWLLLLGTGQGASASTVGQSPDDAGTDETTAPVTVVDPLQAEAEAILGFSLPHTTCESLNTYGSLNRSKMSACVFKKNGKTQVRWFPIYNELPKGYNYNPVETCNLYKPERFVNYSGNAVVEYAMNRCYGDYADPVSDPELDSEPLKLGSHDISNQNNTNKDGKIYPEKTYFNFWFDEKLNCDRIKTPDRPGEWLQLWKKNKNDTWEQIDDLYPTCSSSHFNDRWITLYLKAPKMDQNGSIISFTPHSNYKLNEIGLEPDSTYRILLSADIESVINSETGKVRRLGVFNSLGDIHPQKDKWSGFEFQTDSTPCFVAFTDRWRFGYGSRRTRTDCSYSNKGLANDGKISKIGCVKFTGDGYSFHQEQLYCKQELFPTVDFQTGMQVKDEQCDQPIMDNGCSNIWSAECQKKNKIKETCIENAGKSDEYVRLYYDIDTSDSPENCKGIRRPTQPYYNHMSMSAAEYVNRYHEYRRAGCEGEPDPEPKPDPEIIPDPACKNKVTMDTSGGRWFETPKSSYVNAKGRTVKIKGIHSFWQNEPLKMNVNACAEGWYKLKVQAKNHVGPRPDFYGAYHLNISNEDDGKEYGLSIPASDDRYYSRATFVYLQKGANELNANWTNDAYLEGVYDANIQIKSARIVPFDGVPPGLNTTRKAGRDFCETEGRFFGSDRSIYTDQTGLTAHYCFQDLEAGEYQLIVKAKNKGLAPKDFKNFKVRVKLNGNDKGIIEIPVSSEQYKNGKLRFNMYGDTSRLSLSWINEAPAASAEGKARFELKVLRLKKMGPVTEMELAAYLKSGSMLRIGIILALSILLLSAMLMLRKRRMSRT